MKWFAVLALVGLPVMAGSALADQLSCKDLNLRFSKFDTALTVFDRAGRFDDSTLRTATAQSAMTNILLRQGIILDMIIAQGCDMPAPPEFYMLGLINSQN